MSNDKGSPIFDKELEEVEEMDKKMDEVKEDAVDDADSETEGTLEDELKVEYHTHEPEGKKEGEDDDDEDEGEDNDDGTQVAIPQAPGTGLSGLEKRLKEKEGQGGFDTNLDEMFGTDEATAKCLSELVHYRRINLLTNLDRETIASLTINNALGVHMERGTGSTLLLDMGQHFKELQVSEDGLGRKQVVSLGSFVGGMAQEKRSRLEGFLRPGG